ncbi:rho-associated protein kinase 1 [Patella vulgata]|uniref:rho-associated protein kinase 1 n=1 Tax=Patella vulgata TaxID=6465 RepID=UPI0021807848|nr:rho-associated protein kinase 1 [Patella vulgata]
MFLQGHKTYNLRLNVLNIGKMSVYDLNDLQAKYDVLANEYQICRCKLDSKCEALLILSKELDQCRSERDQFKLMAEQLRERYQALKRQISGRSPQGSSNDLLDVHMYKDMETESLVQLLCDTKEIKKSLQFETDDLKQKLTDAQGDIKLLREQIARQRVGTSDEGMTTRHFPAYEREDLVKQLEASREQYLQLEHDLQQLLDEKEDQETELDAYKRKYENLNRELNYILKGDEKRIVDIDALVMENKYLMERLKQMEEEKTMAMATASKYKSILERKKNKGILKFGQSRSGGLVITQKQVGQMLHNPNAMPSTPQAMADLQGLCGALLDTINDKNLALSHQRKTNKILGSRISELEKKLKTLEVSGLWNVPDMTSLEKLRHECDEVKTLIPRLFSESSDNSVPNTEKLDDLNDFESELSSSTPSSVTSPVHVTQSVRFSANTVHMDDLDLLPTKETTQEVKTTELSLSANQKCLPAKSESEDDESESDQLLAGFIIGKTGRKHTTRKDSGRGKYSKLDSRSLLDNYSQSESESSPEKQKYNTEGVDYDSEMTDKISLLLGDATAKLQNKNKLVEDKSLRPAKNTQKSQVSRKSLPKSSLVINVDCDFDSRTDNSVKPSKVTGSDLQDINRAKNVKNASIDKNLIDMDSPVHELRTLVEAPNITEQIDNDLIKSEETGHNPSSESSAVVPARMAATALESRESIESSVEICESNSKSSGHSDQTESHLDISESKPKLLHHDSSSESHVSSHDPIPASVIETIADYKSCDMPQVSNQEPTYVSVNENNAESTEHCDNSESSTFNHSSTSTVSVSLEDTICQSVEVDNIVLNSLNCDKNTDFKAEFESANNGSSPIQDEDLEPSPDENTDCIPTNCNIVHTSSIPAIHIEKDVDSLLPSHNINTSHDSIKEADWVRETDDDEVELADESTQLVTNIHEDDYSVEVVTMTTSDQEPDSEDGDEFESENSDCIEGNAAEVEMTEGEFTSELLCVEVDNDVDDASKDFSVLTDVSVSETSATEAEDCDSPLVSGSSQNHPLLFDDKNNPSEKSQHSSSNSTNSHMC